MFCWHHSLCNLHCSVYVQGDQTGQGKLGETGNDQLKFVSESNDRSNTDAVSIITICLLDYNSLFC